MDSKKLPHASKRYHSLLGLVVLIGAISLGFYGYKSPIFGNKLSIPLNSNEIELPDFQPLVGVLEPNELLKETKYIVHENLVGPETIEFDENGDLITGLANGRIVRINLKENKMTTIALVGNETDQAQCDEVSLYCKKSCGRPCGIRLKANTSLLYIADTYYGILKVDIKTGEKRFVLRGDDKRFGSKPLYFTNDLDMNGDTVYFIDSSDVREVNEAIEEHIEARPRGRLFAYNEKTDELNLLVDHLYFPNGLQLGPQKDYLLINENSMSRILKYYVSGDRKGTAEIFAIQPGFGDNIRITNRGTFMTAYSAVRKSPRSSVLDLLGSYPAIRDYLGSMLNMRYILLSTNLMPKYGLVVEYNQNGEPIKSWHDPSGKFIQSVSTAVIFNNKLYLGSYHSHYIGVLDYN